MEHSAEQARGVLAGIRVLDFSRFFAGPYCTRLLADAGAEVVKIEPAEGDPTRHSEPIRDGRSSYFGQLNCGKKSVVMDLKASQAVEILHRLVKTCDVVVENFRPKVMDRLGLGYMTLSEIRPDLVYCSISGFGQNGPGAAEAAFAPIVHAASGYDLAYLAYAEGEKPPLNANATADILAAVHAAAAVQGALVQRVRTGKGGYVEVNLMDCMYNLLGYEVQEAQFPRPDSRIRFGAYKTQDGNFTILVLTQKHFNSFAEIADRPEWRTDSRINTVGKRYKNWRIWWREVESWTSTKRTEEAILQLNAAGIPCARYLTVSESLSLPQTASRGSLVEVTDGSGSFRVPIPIHYHGQPLRGARYVSDLGEDTASVLGEIGMSPSEIDALIVAGVIGTTSKGC